MFQKKVNYSNRLQKSLSRMAPEARFLVHPYLGIDFLFSCLCEPVRRSKMDAGYSLLCAKSPLMLPCRFLRCCIRDLQEKCSIIPSIYANRTCKYLFLLEKKVLRKCKKVFDIIESWVYKGLVERDKPDSERHRLSLLIVRQGRACQVGKFFRVPKNFS